MEPLQGSDFIRDISSGNDGTAPRFGLHSGHFFLLMMEPLRGSDFIPGISSY